MQTAMLDLDRLPHNGTPEYDHSYVDSDGRKWGGQCAIISAGLENDFVMACFGRSAGKTSTGPTFFVTEGALCTSVYEYAYAAPTFRPASEEYRRWKRIFLNHLEDHSDSTLQLRVKPWGLNRGAVVDFWGLEEHDHLRYYRKHRIQPDEAKDVERDAIFATLSNMLLGRAGHDGIRGGVLVTYTPSRFGAGAQWTKECYQKGKQRVDGYCTVTAPSMCNPYLTEAEIQKLIARCPDGATIREEIYAEHVEGEGAVFTNLPAVFSIAPIRVEGMLTIAEDPDQGEGHGKRGKDPYVIGYDAAASRNRDVASVFNERTGNQAALLVMPGSTPVHEKRHRVEQLRARYNGATVYYDDTGGYGNAVAQDAGLREGTGWVAVTWTSDLKENNVTIARYLCERAGAEQHGRAWHLIQHDIQRSEFEDYQVTAFSREGRPLKVRTYGPTPGLHDDTVSAACLVAPRLDLPRPTVMLPEGPPAKFSVEWWKALQGQRDGDSVILDPLGFPRR